MKTKVERAEREFCQQIKKMAAVFGVLNHESF